MKKRVLLCFILALSVAFQFQSFSFLGEASASSSRTAKVKATYTPSQAMELIQNEKDLLIVDVRSKQELRDGMIKGSINVPFVNFMRGAHNLPKDRTLLIVCAVGGRSYVAMQVLAHQGYNRLYNLKGGISSWAEEKLPLVF